LDYYEKDNAEIIGILERPIIEAAVVANFLLQSEPSVIQDYRKCSYKDRLRILRNLKAGSAFYETKAGKRLLKSVQEKMAFENLTEEDFELQKKNRWRIQGKTFFDIFSEVEHADLYAATYGIMSESIHGSWNESMDWCLAKNDDGTFSTWPFYHGADVRYVAPMLRFTNRPYRLWLERIDAYGDNLRQLLDWVERVNASIFRQYDENFDGWARPMSLAGIDQAGFDAMAQTWVEWVRREQINARAKPLLKLKLETGKGEQIWRSARRELDNQVNIALWAGFIASMAAKEGNAWHALAVQPGAQGAELLKDTGAGHGFSIPQKTPKLKQAGDAVSIKLGSNHDL
jgi:hypothetical protein